MIGEKHIEEIMGVLLKLTYDLRTNMTSITRYVRHERSKHPTLTEGQFLDRHLEYKELANVAVGNILKCINDNEELRKIENMCFKEIHHKYGENATELPCRVGDTVYYISRYYTGKFEIHECVVDHITVYRTTMFLSLIDMKDRNKIFGVNCSDTSLFFNQEDAKQALVRTKGGAE